MNKLRPLIDIIGKDDDVEELYTTDQKKRYYRSQKGRYSRKKGLFNFLHLIKDWEAIVGKMMAQNTIPLKIKSNILYISTKHSIFAQELGFLTPMILEKVKSHFTDLENEVTKIKFVHSNFSSSQFSSEKSTHMNKIKETPRKKLHPFSPEFLEKKAKAEHYFSNIEDDEIKKILTDFMLS